MEADITVDGTVAVDEIIARTDVPNSVETWSLTGGTLDMELDGLQVTVIHDGAETQSGRGPDDPNTTFTNDSLVTGGGGFTFETQGGYRNARTTRAILTNASNDFTGGIVVRANKAGGSGAVALRVNSESAMGRPD